MPFDIGEMYSGLMPIKAGDSSRALFFVFQPQIVDKSDTITIWLNGGPGCSSLEGDLDVHCVSHELVAMLIANFRFLPGEWTFLVDGRPCGTTYQ